MKKAIEKVKGVKKHEIFFVETRENVNADNVCSDSDSRSKLDSAYTISRLINVVRRALVSWFDAWRWFLTLFILYIFFDYILPVPTMFLASYGASFGYGWLILWLVVAGILAYHEVKRRGEATCRIKWFYNPNAVDEYLELMNK